MSALSATDAALERADYRTVLLEGVPLIDVRSPNEFARGALPDAVNLPLLDDAEREAVGTCYRREGAAAAMSLGETLVSGEVRTSRVHAWLAFAKEHPDAAIHCWRGGLRSRIVQQWLCDAGATVPRIAGGFKALRQCGITVLDDFARERSLVVLAGRTGAGKTRLLSCFAASLDLEAIANHRGSAFGGHAAPQPSPVTFENRLAQAVLRLPAWGPVLVEDESRTIGRLALPAALHARMQSAPAVVLESELTTRIEHILEEYVLHPLASGWSADALAARYLDALTRIRKRLGSARHDLLVGEIGAAFASGDPDAHRAWIARLLVEYYDPMYDHQIERKAERIVFRGDLPAVRAFLECRLGAGEFRDLESTARRPI